MAGGGWGEEVWEQMRQMSAIGDASKAVGMWEMWGFKETNGVGKGCREEEKQTRVMGMDRVNKVSVGINPDGKNRGETLVKNLPNKG